MTMKRCGSWTVTATLGGLMARFKYRYDKSKLPTFERNVGGLQDGQHTVAASPMFSRRIEDS